MSGRRYLMPAARVIPAHQQTSQQAFKREEMKMTDINKQPTKEMLDEGVIILLSYPILEADEDIFREALANAFMAMVKVSSISFSTGR
jgi:hypothetical protein